MTNHEITHRAREEAKRATRPRRQHPDVDRDPFFLWVGRILIGLAVWLAVMNAIVHTVGVEVVQRLWGG